MTDITQSGEVVPGQREIAYAAWGYAQRGWHVLPVHWITDQEQCSCLPAPWAPSCASAGKHPIDAQWPDTASTDPYAIVQWWAAEYPRANIGIATGTRSGIFVLDVDTGAHSDNTPKQGLASLESLTHQYGALPDTFTVRTGSGGVQFYFLLPEALKIKSTSTALGTAHPDIDTRGEGGQVVAPPSISSKGRYTVERDVPPVAAPEWLLELLKSAGTATPLHTLNGHTHGQQSPPEGTAGGSPGAAAHSTGPAPSWVPKALEERAEEIRTAPRGRANEINNRVGYMIGQYVGSGWLSREAAEALVIDAAQKRVPPNREAPFTLRRALNQGVQHPYTPARTEVRDATAVWPAINGTSADAPAATGVQESLPTTPVQPLSVPSGPLPETPPGMPGKRPRVIVSNQANAAEWLRGELGQGELSCLFRRNGVLVHTPRIGEDGYREPREEEIKRGIHPGPAQVQPVSQFHVKALVEVRYDVHNVKKDKETGLTYEVPSLFPMPSASSAVNAACINEGTPNIRELEGITHTPVLRPDGSVLDTPGYDEDTGLLYLPEPGLKVPSVPSHPDADQLRTALDFILKPVAQFPFVQPSHRNNWLAAMLTPLLRQLLPPPYPWVIISAPQRGSGKTLLAKIIGLVHGMTTRGELPESKEEQRKTFTAVLYSTTAPVVLFDNLTGVVRSAELDKLLTNLDYSDRVLGRSEEVRMVNDRLWLGTGNNAKIGGDLSRRTWPVVINTNHESPHLRTGFALNPEKWIPQHRGEYLAALLTLARGWVQAGSPAKTSRSDSYELWEGSMCGLMEWAGLGSDFGRDAEGHEYDSEDDTEWATFIAEVHRVFGGYPFTSTQITEQLRESTAAVHTLQGVDPESLIRAETLPGDLAERWSKGSGRTAGLAKSLGKWLSNHEGRYVSGHVVRMVSNGKNGKEAKRYKIEVS